MNEELIDLMVAVMVYIEAKTEVKNPFVKNLGRGHEEDAFNFLVESLHNCRHLYGEIDNLAQKRMTEINAQNGNENSVSSTLHSDEKGLT